MKTASLAVVSAAMFILVGCCSQRQGATALAPDSKTHRYEFQQDDLDQSIAARVAEKGPQHPLQVLVLSGGGSNGAWGAGFLKGWGSKGTRPEFDLVTGVSTGGLLATGSFLGDDAMLQQAFTTTKDSDVKGNRFFLTIPFSDSVYTSKPLKKLIAKYITNQVIDRVAAEAAKNRRLFVASTDLDAGRLHIWDLTRIAAAHDYDFYRTALLASASAPMIFPPVNIEGTLHADGGVKANLFFRNNLLPRLAKSHQKAQLHLRAESKATQLPEPSVYVIVNGQLDPGMTAVQNCLLPLAQRSVSCLMDSNNIGCLYETKYWAADLHYDFRLAFIPNDAPACESFTFDEPKMQALYAVAVQYGQQYADQKKWMDLPEP